MSEYKFTEHDFKRLAKLPAAVAQLAQKYPEDILTLADFWDEPPYPNGYIPEEIEIYYDDPLVPYLCFERGRLSSFIPTEPGDEPKMIVVMIDHQWAYAQYEGKVVFDRLGGVVLPEVLVNKESLLKKAIAFLDSESE